MTTFDVATHIEEASEKAYRALKAGGDPWQCVGAMEALIEMAVEEIRRLNTTTVAGSAILAEQCADCGRRVVPATVTPVADRRAS